VARLTELSMADLVSEVLACEQDAEDLLSLSKEDLVMVIITLRDRVLTEDVI